MTRVSALAALLAFCLVSGASADDGDGVMRQYFSIWSDNGRITPQAVRSLYGRRVDYYGRRMGQEEVYRDKINLTHRWPDRGYHPVPGTVIKHCDASQGRCGLSVVLTWTAANEARGATTHGRAIIQLALEKQDGVLKIVRESQGSGRM